MIRQIVIGLVGLVVAFAGGLVFAGAFSVPALVAAFVLIVAGLSLTLWAVGAE